MLIGNFVNLFKHITNFLSLVIIKYFQFPTIVIINLRISIQKPHVVDDTRTIVIYIWMAINLKKCEILIERTISMINSI